MCKNLTQSLTITSKTLLQRKCYSARNRSRISFGAHYSTYTFLKYAEVKLQTYFIFMIIYLIRSVSIASLLPLLKFFQPAHYTLINKA